MTESDRHDARRNWMRPSEVGERCGGVTAGQVCQWIKDGDLKAFNAAKKNAKRPDYRIRPEWVDEFEKKRTVNRTAA